MFICIYIIDAGYVVCGEYMPQTGQLCGIVSPLPLLCGFWGGVSSLVRQVSLPAESSRETESHPVRPRAIP